MSACEMELCRNWTGDGCSCRVLDMEPDIIADFEAGDYPTPTGVGVVEIMPCRRCGFVGVHVCDQPESAAKGPSETRPERLQRAAAALRASAYTDKALYCQIADLLGAAATVGSYGAIAEAADRLARSLLGEPEVDRG